MPCYCPLKGWRSRTPTVNGKFSVVFNPSAGFIDRPVEVPCGQCIGCRLERSRQWAIRCVHESSLYENNCFITLTYDDEHLPEGMTLVKSDFQKFMKRLRERFGSGVRYFHCGEYGERFGRPHYHACLFNFDFSDKVLWRRSHDGIPVYTSSVLSDIWGLGFCTVGDVTFESAAYVARYVLKKVTGDAAKEHYTYIDEHTGEFYERQPEYTTMSRRPGIGHRWYSKFRSDVFPDDFVVVRGLKMKPPKYYNRQYEIEAPKEFERIQFRRGKLAFRRRKDATYDRLAVRERVVKARIKQLKRSIDDGNEG